VPGLVDVDELKPGDLIGTNKDSFLILEKLPTGEGPPLLPGVLGVCGHAFRWLGGARYIHSNNPHAPCFPSLCCLPRPCAPSPVPRRVSAQSTTLA
jgi:hypothetical protein